MFDAQATSSDLSGSENDVIPVPQMQLCSKASWADMSSCDNVDADWAEASGCSDVYGGCTESSPATILMQQTVDSVVTSQCARSPDIPGYGYHAMHGQAIAGYATSNRKGKPHHQVPKTRAFAKESEKKQRDRPKTTVMMRNVPNQYSRSQLMSELNRIGWQNKYDFVYLPFDTSTGFNVGYAFVNFFEADDCALCINVMQGYEFAEVVRGHHFKRAAIVSIAHVQGLKRNLQNCSRGVLRSQGCAAVEGPWVHPAAKA
jgi:hypothetical protein